MSHPHRFWARKALAAAMAMSVPHAAAAQENAAASPPPTPLPPQPVARAVADPMTTDLGFGIKLNPFSTLRRQWIVVNDPALPVTFKEPCGLRVSYQDRNYRFSSFCDMQTSQPISAFELRVVPITIFGERLTTLTATDIRDFAPGANLRLTSQWNLWRENDAEEFYASVAFIAAVRLADGRILKSDLKLALDEVSRLSGEVSPEDLRRAPPPDQPGAR